MAIKERGRIKFPFHNLEGYLNCPEITVANKSLNIKSTPIQTSFFPSYERALRTNLGRSYEILSRQLVYGEGQKRIKFAKHKDNEEYLLLKLI